MRTGLTLEPVARAKVDGKAVAHVDRIALHNQMQGPLNSVLAMELQRPDGKNYSVALRLFFAVCIRHVTCQRLKFRNVRRHKFHDMDAEAVSNLGTVYKDGTDAEKQVLLGM